jgi:predicted Zn-dependent protease
MVVADQAGQQGSVRTLSYFIKYNNAIYHLIGAAALHNFPNVLPAFNASMANFSVLTDQEKINRKPDRIAIKTVSSASTLREVLKSYNTPDARLEEIAILNGMLLTDKVPAGTMIKVVSK